MLVFFLLQLNEKERKLGIPDLDMYADDFDEKEKAGLDATAAGNTSGNDEKSSGDNSGKQLLKYDTRRCCQSFRLCRTESLFLTEFKAVQIIPIFFS